MDVTCEPAHVLLGTWASLLVIRNMHNCMRTLEFRVTQTMGGQSDCIRICLSRNYWRKDSQHSGSFSDRPVKVQPCRDTHETLTQKIAFQAGMHGYDYFRAVGSVESVEMTTSQKLSGLHVSFPCILALLRLVLAGMPQDSGEEAKHNWVFPCHHFCSISST